MEQKKEAEIIARVIKGDRQAYALLVEEYKRPIYNLALRMTGSIEDADDLAQEIFIRAYSNMWRFDERKSFFTWLYTIGLNLIRNHLKKKIRESERKATEAEVAREQGREHHQVAENNIAADYVMKLEEALQKLPVDWREAVILRFYFELSFEEVAKISGTSASAAKMRVYRGLEKLRQILEHPSY